MQIRQQVRQLLVTGLGEEVTAKAGEVERRVRRRMAAGLDPQRRAARPRAKRRRTGPTWQPADPFVEFPTPTMSRHDLLAHLHQELQPRTYFEIGVSRGLSMTLSRARSIGVDPAFKVDQPLECDVRLVRAKSDAFFADEEAFARFGGTPVDLAFIDGLHLSEFALRDFMNTEKVMSRAGVVVIDDVLPRNALEAARDRKTKSWAGDVYKVVMILKEQRPDLVVIPVNTSPTGTVVVVGLDPDSRVLEENYEENLRFCEEPDPQAPPDWILHRTTALSADDVAKARWTDLADVREDPTAVAVGSILDSFPS